MDIKVTGGGDWNTVKYISIAILIFVMKCDQRGKSGDWIAVKTYLCNKLYILPQKPIVIVN